MKHIWMEWKECNIHKALTFANGKTINKKWPRDGQSMNEPHHCADTAVFTDGTAVACLSQWRGPLSEVTPDIDAEPPKWWIGKPAISKNKGEADSLLREMWQWQRNIDELLPDDLANRMVKYLSNE